MHGNLRYRLSLFALVGLALLFSGCNNNAGARPPAPDFKLLDMHGKEVSLSQFRGSPVILDFWATWCPPCRMSIPELVKIQEEYKDKGLVILALSLDDPSHASNAYLREFQKEYKINYRILRANQRVLVDYFGYENLAIPTMFFVDRDGRIVNKIVGFRPSAVKTTLAELFKE
ncbi:MAG TPA: TlpA family protein disulfide reductase [Desulfobacterales bacterium]|nr:TlpA family protein disulfide reductase [Desulfobacterales bacterium]